MQNSKVIFDYVIFHRNCLDGFSSFIILTKTGVIANDAIIYPDVPSAKEEPPGLGGKNVIIVDVAYKEQVLERIFQEAEYVLFIDHHVTIRNDVLRLITLYPQHHIVYDSAKSAVQLTWDYFFPDKKVPWFVRYIGDNDIGEWRLKNTRDFILGLQVNYPLELTRENIEKWNNLYDNNEIKRLIRDGRKYGEYETFLLNTNSKRYSLEQFPSQMIFDDFPDFFREPGQYRVAVINGSGCPSTSLLGKRIVDTVDCDFCMIWMLHLDKKEMVISFRSNKADVGSIAQLFGGGGHKFASATSIPLSRYNITDLFFPTSLPRSRK